MRECLFDNSSYFVKLLSLSPLKTCHFFSASAKTKMNECSYKRESPSNWTTKAYEYSFLTHFMCVSDLCSKFAFYPFKTTTLRLNLSPFLLLFRFPPAALKLLNDVFGEGCGPRAAVQQPRGGARVGVHHRDERPDDGHHEPEGAEEGGRRQVIQL